MADLSNELDLNVPAAPSLTLDAAPAAPTLTLDPAADEKVIAESKKATPVQVEDTPLSPEEQKMVNDFAEKIDITNSQMVLQYGAASQKKLSDFSETALSRVKTKDMGETGELITNLISELQGFDAATEQPKGIFGFFKKTSNSIEQLKTRYDSADKNVERIKAQLEDHQVTLMKDITMLDKMYELNLVYFKELTMYILAGKKKLAEVRANDLKAAQEKAQRTQLPEDAQAARIDLQRRVQSVFHREVGDRRRLRIGFFAHVFVEHGVDAVEHRKERTVLFQLLQPFERQPVEEYDRVLLALRPQLLVDVLEQVAGAAGPAPPKVVREHFEGVETLGKHLLDHHAVPVRFFGDELLPHEIDLFGRAASVVEHRTVGTGHRTFDRFGIGFFVGCVEFAPQGRARQFGGGVAGDFDLLRGIFGEMQQRLGDFASCFGVVVVVACDERHALVFALRTGPESESGQRGGERRYREGRRLERRVSPRLVVRGEERHVHSHQQFVVALVEDAVAAVEVGGDEDHLHLRRRVGQHAAGDRVEDLIPFGMFEIVGAEAVLLGIDRAVFVGQMRLQILAGAGTVM